MKCYNKMTDTKLPFKEGDTVWVIEGKTHIQAYRVIRLPINETNPMWLMRWSDRKDYFCTSDCIGKTVLATEEGAVAKLKKIQGEQL